MHKFECVRYEENAQTEWYVARYVVRHCVNMQPFGLVLA